MWERFKDFKTGIVDDVPVNLIGIEGTSNSTMKMDRYDIGLGDAVLLFAKHHSLPWWKKDRMADFDMDILKRKLNEQLEIVFHL